MGLALLSGFIIVAEVVFAGADTIHLVMSATVAAVDTSHSGSV